MKVLKYEFEISYDYYLLMIISTYYKNIIFFSIYIYKIVRLLTPLKIAGRLKMFAREIVIS